MGSQQLTSLLQQVILIWFCIVKAEDENDYQNNDDFELNIAGVLKKLRPLPLIYNQWNRICYRMAVNQASEIYFIEPLPKTCFSEGLCRRWRWRRGWWQCSCFHRIIVKCCGYCEDWCYKRCQYARYKGADYAKLTSD